MTFLRASRGEGSVSGEYNENKSSAGSTALLACAVLMIQAFLSLLGRPGLWGARRPRPLGSRAKPGGVPRSLFIYLPSSGLGGNEDLVI